MRCLIVDDNRDDRDLVERIIRGGGHRTRAVAGGRDAIEVLASERFDVAVVDLRMDGMSGVETLRELRRCDSAMRLLVVSGFDDHKNVLAAFAAGADGYIIKTANAEDLTRALHDVRAGKSPMSGQVGAVLVRQMRARLGSEPPEPSGQPIEDPVTLLGRVSSLRPKNEN